MPLDARPVPLQEYQPRVPVEEGLRRIIPRAPEENLGPSLEHLGASLQAVAHGDAARWTMETMATGQQQWLQHMKDAQQTAGPGAPGFTDKVMADYQKYIKDTTKNAPSPLAAKMVQPHLAEFGLHLYNAASGFEGAARHEHGVLTMQQSREASQQIVHDDPTQYDAQMALNTHLINGLNVGAEDKEKGAYELKTGLGHFAVLGDIDREPFKALQTLTSAEPAKPGPYADITAEQRYHLANEAQRVIHERLEDAEHSRRLAREDQKDASDNVFKEGWTLQAQGKLTPQWVMAHEKVMEPAAYGEMMRLAGVKPGGAEGEETDDETYLKLLMRAHGGEDVMGTPANPGDAYVAFQGGLIDLKQAATLVNASAKGQPDWIKRGTEYISTMSGYSELNPNIASAQVKGRMMDKWQDWVAKHPNATIKEAQPAYQDIVAHEMVSTMAGLPPLRNVMGSSLAPDLDAVKRLDRADFDAGRMSRQELDRELSKISMYDYMLKLANPDQKPKGNESAGTATTQSTAR